MAALILGLVALLAAGEVWVEQGRVDLAALRRSVDREVPPGASVSVVRSFFGRRSFPYGEPESTSLISDHNIDSRLAAAVMRGSIPERVFFGAAAGVDVIFYLDPRGRVVRCDLKRYYVGL